MEIKRRFIERWNSSKQRKASRTITRLEEEALADVIKTKDEFIVYLQDEIAELKAIIREKETQPERVRKEVDFESGRGYKPLHTRMRERVLASRAKVEPNDSSRPASEPESVDATN